MTATEPTVALVLAAGLSKRFGTDKILAEFRGKPLGAYIAETLVSLPADHRLAVCPANSRERTNLYASHGFEVIANPEPERGLASSLALGAQRSIELGAHRLLVCLADMPLVPATHLHALLSAAEQHEIIVTESGGIRMPPAVFSRTRLRELTTLTGDTGARALLQAAQAVHLPSEQAQDIDTPLDAGTQ